MDPENPYASPAADLTAPASSASDGGVTDRMLSCLRATRPWTRLIGVTTLLGAVLMVVMGIVIMVTDFSGEAPAALKIGMGIYYIVIALLYIMPAVFLFRFSSGVTNLEASPGWAQAEPVFEATRKFWKFVGIMMIVMMCLIPLIMIIAFIAAFSAGMSQM